MPFSCLLQSSFYRVKVGVLVGKVTGRLNANGHMCAQAAINALVRGSSVQQSTHIAIFSYTHVFRGGRALDDQTTFRLTITAYAKPIINFIHQIRALHRLLLLAPKVCNDARCP